MGRITGEDPAAVLLLNCAPTWPRTVPLDLFTPTARAARAAGRAAADQLAFNDVLRSLVDYSLAKRTPPGCSCTGSSRPSPRPQPGLPLLAREDSRRRMSGWPAGGGVGAAAGRRAGPQGAPQDWPRWAVLLPHVLAAAGHTARPAAGHGRGRCFLAAGPRRHLPAGPRPARRGPAAAGTRPGHRRGRLRPRPPRRRHRPEQPGQDPAGPGPAGEARPLQERALAIAEAAYGPDHPTVATDLNNLARILQDLGQPEQARPLQERALAIAEAAYGPDHPDVAADLNNLATILQDLGQPAQARPLQERALAIAEAAYGPDHPTVATELNNLATILRDLGQPAGARPLDERALAITEARRAASAEPGQ